MQRKRPICGRFPNMPMCGCTIPCQQSMNEVQLEMVKPQLFVGPIEVAFKTEELQNAGVTHIVDISGDHYTKRPDLFQYLTLDDVTDDPSTDIIKVFQKVKDFIHSGMEEGGNRAVLVHCKAGISRSVAVVVAYLMWTERMPFDQALYLVQKARPQANPNVGFRKQLLTFQEDLGIRSHRGGDAENDVL